MDPSLFFISAIVNNTFLPLYVFHSLKFCKYDYWSKEISVFIDLETICQSTFQKTCSNFLVVSSMLCTIVSSVVWTWCLSYLEIPFCHLRINCGKLPHIVLYQAQMLLFLAGFTKPPGRVSGYFYCVPEYSVITPFLALIKQSCLL